MSHREASLAEVLATVAAMTSGRPKPELVLAWVRTMVQDEDLVDSKEVAHTFRCDETYVCWCCEIGIRRGELRYTDPYWRLQDVSPPVEAWARSRLDPLARLALEAVHDDAVADRPVPPPPITGPPMLRRSSSDRWPAG